MFAPHYFAKGGEAAVMSEFLLRGYNVAVPAVDSGDDIYVVGDGDGNLIRIQVKSANCKKKPYGACGQVRLKLAQLSEVKKTPLVYIFALRFENLWHYIIIHREDLLTEHELHNTGTVKNDWIWFRFKFFMNLAAASLRPSSFILPPSSLPPRVTCSDRDFSEYVGWEKFPSITN